MQQIKLTEFNESYAVSIEDGLPEKQMEVFMKLSSGAIFKGEFFPKERGFYGDHFDNSNGVVIEPQDVAKWHPVKVDL